MTLAQRLVRAFKSAVEPAAQLARAAVAAHRAAAKFNALTVRIQAMTVPTHGYCIKCAVWLRLDVRRGRCTVCNEKLTPME